MLNGRCMQRGADLFEKPGACCVLVGHRADFDQLVTGEVLVDFIHYGGGKAGVADHHDRVETVGARAQFTALY